MGRTFRHAERHLRTTSGVLHNHEPAWGEERQLQVDPALHAHGQGQHDRLDGGRQRRGGLWAGGYYTLSQAATRVWSEANRGQDRPGPQYFSAVDAVECERIEGATGELAGDPDIEHGV